MNFNHIPIPPAAPMRIFAITLLVISGCALPNRLRQAENGNPVYEQVEIVYRVGNGQGSTPPASLRQTSTSMADQGEAALDQSGGSWKSAHLKIEYPHPENVDGMARATLVLSQGESTLPAQPSIGRRIAEGFSRLATRENEPQRMKSGICAATSGPDDEIWVLDFPKQQLDLLLADLEQSGFFANQTRPTGGAHLQVGIDRDRLQKTWTPEPRLDDFVTRVFREGMLEGFVTVGLCESSMNQSRIVE